VPTKRTKRDPQYRITLLVTSEELSLIESASRADRKEVGDWCLRTVLEVAERRAPRKDAPPLRGGSQATSTGETDDLT